MPKLKCRKVFWLNGDTLQVFLGFGVITSREGGCFVIEKVGFHAWRCCGLNGVVEQFAGLGKVVEMVGCNAKVGKCCGRSGRSVWAC